MQGWPTLNHRLRPAPIGSFEFHCPATYTTSKAALIPHCWPWPTAYVARAIYPLFLTRVIKSPVTAIHRPLAYNTITVGNQPT